MRRERGIGQVRDVDIAFRRRKLVDVGVLDVHHPERVVTIVVIQESPIECHVDLSTENHGNDFLDSFEVQLVIGNSLGVL